MATQLDWQVAIGKESAFKTAVTPDRAFLCPADHAWNITRTDAEVLRPGTQVQRSDRAAVTKYEGMASLALEAETKGFGYLLAALFGTVTNTAISGGFQQVHTLKNTDYLDSYTMQFAVPPLGPGSVQPVTYAGCVANKLTIDAQPGAIVKTSLDWLTSAISTATAAVAPSYPATSGLFTFVHGSVGYAGTLTAPTTTALGSLSGAAAANVRGVQVTVDRGLDSNGWNLGGGGQRTRPPALGKASIGISMTVEYTDNTLRAAYLAQSRLPVVLTFAHDDGVSVLQLVLPDVRLNGELPKSNGGDVITVPVAGTGYADPGGLQPIYAVYRTTDTTP